MLKVHCLILIAAILIQVVWSIYYSSFSDIDSLPIVVAVILSLVILEVDRRLGALESKTNAKTETSLEE